MEYDRTHRRLSGFFAVALGGIAAFAGAQLLTGNTPAMMAGGLFLCAAAPLGFILRSPNTKSRQHPVVISALCGFGCVMVMVGIQRYGNHHQPMLVAALLALIVWMVYQKKIWRG